ncbi:MAG: hypothetical protein DRP71_09865 [Verrucomicrobia bacterium]|nr:MAG: hypothetical protein DRP71_09865 [Verrucomicrobiota bacterium]
MKSLHIRDLHEDTLSGLKRRAVRHRRSLQKEVKLLLEEAAQMLPDDAAPEADLKLHIVHSGNQSSSWRREAIYGDDGR